MALTPALATLALTHMTTPELERMADTLTSEYAVNILKRELAIRATIPAPRKR